MSAPPLRFDVFHARRWTITHLRLQLKSAHGSFGAVQGGWWPLTD